LKKKAEIRAKEAKKELAHEWWLYLIYILSVCAVVSAIYAIGLHLYYHPINYDYRNDKTAKTMILHKNTSVTRIDFNNRSISVNTTNDTTGY